MSPILTGVIASGISGHLTPPWSPEGAYDSLATVSLSTATASITFSGIPSGYKHLELRYIGRTTHTSQTFGKVSMNGDTSTSNYRAHDLFGTGTSAIASDYGGQTGIAIQKFPGTNSASGIFGAGILTILDYANTSKYKTARNLGGQDSNGSGEIDFVSGLWMSTSAITSFSIVLSSGNIDTNSQFALYGVK